MKSINQCKTVDLLTSVLHTLEPTGYQINPNIISDFRKYSLKKGIDLDLPDDVLEYLRENDFI